MRSRWFFSALACLVLLVIIGCAFGRTIGSYFLEDDIGEVLYVHQIFSGHWQQIIDNFTGNYMGISTMKVYRPCLLLSIMADYAVWKTNSAGYFVTNMLFLLGTAIALYMVLLELTRFWDSRRAMLFAFFAAALFASNALHCESVSFMVGRVDVICAFFYLFSLWCFIRKGDARNWILTFVGIVSFWLAILTKEMAIGLPVLLPVICFLFADILSKDLIEKESLNVQRPKPGFLKRVALAINVSYPLWISTLLYFIIRYFALGTFVGGYVGSVGANQFSHILQKWTDIDTLGRIIFPLNQSVFAGHPYYYKALAVIYFALVVVIFARLLISGFFLAWLFLLGAWVLTTLAPIYQLWGLGFNLEGARFLFFLTIPLSIILPLLVFAPNKSDINSNYIKEIRPLDAKIIGCGILVFSVLVILGTVITAKNDIPWIHAGKQIISLREQGQKLAHELENSANGNSAKAILLGIPKETGGAHIIYNGLTFGFLMAPPFADKDYTDKFITFDPILYGNGNLLNTSRFRDCLRHANMVGCYKWQFEKKEFEKLEHVSANHLVNAFNERAEKGNLSLLNFPFVSNILWPYTEHRGLWQIDADNIKIENCENGSTIAIGPITVDPFSTDFLEVELSGDPDPNIDQVIVHWSDVSNDEKNKNAAIAISAIPQESTNEQAKKYKVYRVPLSRYWRWFTANKIERLWLEFPGSKSLSVKSIRLCDDHVLVPILQASVLASDNTGVYHLNNQPLALKVDSSQINNSLGSKLEISKANYFFENLNPASSEDAVMSSFTINEPAKEFALNNSAFPGPGYYQLRVIGLDKDGKQTGEWSDSLTVKI